MREVRWTFSACGSALWRTTAPSRPGSSSRVIGGSPRWSRRSWRPGFQWPDPWLSLNPSFTSGGPIPELVAEGLLHPECDRIFRVKRDVADPGGRAITLHQHQRDAVVASKDGSLTPGAGCVHTPSVDGRPLTALDHRVAEAATAWLASARRRRLRPLVAAIEARTATHPHLTRAGQPLGRTASPAAPRSARLARYRKCG